MSQLNKTHAPTNSFFDYIMDEYKKNKEKMGRVSYQESNIKSIRDDAEHSTRLFTVASILGISPGYVMQTRTILEMMLKSLDDPTRPIFGISLTKAMSKLCDDFFFTGEGLPAISTSRLGDRTIILPIDEIGTTGPIREHEIHRTLIWLKYWMQTPEIVEEIEELCIFTVDEWKNYILRIVDNVQSNKHDLYLAILHILGYDRNDGWEFGTPGPYYEFEAHAALACLKMHMLYAEETRPVDISMHAIQQLRIFYDKDTELWSEFHDQAKWPEKVVMPQHPSGKAMAFSPKNMNNFYDAAMALLVKED